jgi:hypothetical protein
MAHLAHCNEITILGYPSALSEIQFPWHEFIIILLSRQFLLQSDGNTGVPKTYCSYMKRRIIQNTPPSCGRSVTDFWGWDAHEARLRCPDEVDGDTWIWSTRSGLNLISTNYPDHVHLGDFPLSGKNPHGRAWNRTRDLMISSQKRLPLDHEAGHRTLYITWYLCNKHIYGKV